MKRDRRLEPKGEAVAVVDDRLHPEPYAEGNAQVPSPVAEENNDLTVR